MSIEVTTATAPASWACYLINGDATGFDYSNTPTDAAGDRDRADCDHWLDTLADDGWYVVSCEGEAKFSCADVLTYVLHRKGPVKNG